jgi:hypothetical protein
MAYADKNRQLAYVRVFVKRHYWEHREEILARKKARREWLSECRRLMNILLD